MNNISKLLCGCALLSIAYRCFVYRRNPKTFVPQKPMVQGLLDNAALDWAYKYHKRAILNSHEVGGLLVAKDTSLRAIESDAYAKGSQNRLSIMTRKEYEASKQGYTVYAHIHSHAQENINYDGEHFFNGPSFVPSDIREYNHVDNGILGYVCTPRGRLIRYNTALDYLNIKTKNALTTVTNILPQGTNFDGSIKEVCAEHSIPYDTRYVGVSGTIRRIVDNVCYKIGIS